MSSKAVPDRQANMGVPIPRVEARDKVTGRAQYPADVPVANPAYAWLVTSAIAKGEVTAIDRTQAQAVPGILDIVTHEDISGDLHPPTFLKQGGTSSTTIRPLTSRKILHDGQIVAVVVADTLEAAREAAYAIKVSYASEPAAASFGSAGVTTAPASKDDPQAKDLAVGNFDQAYATAAVKFEAEYGTSTQHHNPIELFSTTAVWDNDQLTIYEPSQFVFGLKNGVAEQLAMPASKIRVVSTYVGGAFGAKGSVTPRTAIVAVLARRLQRPVKLVMTREQGFTNSTHRAETRHSLKIGAQQNGKLIALSHEGSEVTSRPDSYSVSGTKTTARIYAVPNIIAKVNVVHADRSTPGFMRSPPEVPYMFALESALDELATKLQMDPIELRRVNDTQNEPFKNLPYTSRSLMKCYDEASAAFDWSRRKVEPRSMQDGDWLVGLGCATAIYPSHVASAAARVRMTVDGEARVEIAAHDVGSGTYTVVAQTAAERLGLKPEQVRVVMADSALPPAPVSGGSNVTASACNVVAKACDAIRDKFVGAARQMAMGPAGNETYRLEAGKLVASAGQSVDLKALFERMGAGAIEEYAEYVPEGSKPGAMAKLYKGGITMTGGMDGEDRVSAAFGAEFVEVHIHKRTREIRVPRIVGAFAAGHIVNPRTTHSQLMGGLIWGISSALHEDTELDARAARLVNTNLADYLIPVNADIGDVQVILVPEEDTKVNPLGIKGVGELANVGTSAAIANAVYHATGIRIRELPIRLEKLLVS